MASNLSQRTYLAFSIVILLFVGVGLNSLAPSLKLTSSATLALLLLGWLALHRRELPVQVALLITPYAGLLLVQAISLLWTPLPQPAAELWLQGLLLFGFLAFVTSTVLHGWPARAWLEAVILTTAALCLVELLLFTQWLSGWRTLGARFGPLPPVGYRASGLLVGHPNVLSGLINLCIPLAIIFGLQAHARSRRLAFVGLLGLLFICQYLTSSRTGWIALVASLATMAALAFLVEEHGGRSIPSRIRGTVKRWGPIRWSAAIAVVSGLGYAALWQISRTGHAHISRARFPVWEAAWNIVRRAPIWGTGLGSFPPLFAGQSMLFNQESVPHAHNLALQLHSDSGVPGLILVAAFLIGLVLFGYRRWQGGVRAQRLQLAAYGAIGAGLLTHHLADYLFGPPLYTMSVLALTGVFLAQSTPPKSQQPRTVKVGPWIGGLAIAGALALALLLAGAWSHWQATTAGRGQDWASAAENGCANLARQPSSAAYAHTCALARDYSAMLDVDVSQRPDLDFRPYLEAAQSDPHWFRHWANAGVAALQRGEYDAAASYLDLAIKLAPHSADLILNRGYVEELRGRTDAAASHYRHAARRQPWIYYSWFIQSSEFRRRALAGQRLDRYLSGDQTLLWWSQQALETDRLVAADRILALSERALPSNARVYALRAQYYLKRGDQAQAERYAAVGHFIRPTDPWVALSLARVERAAGNTEEADNRILASVSGQINSSSSERYYFAAHRRFSLQVDRHPLLLQAGAPAALGDRVAELLFRADLSGEQRAALELFAAQSGVGPLSIESQSR